MVVVAMLALLPTFAAAAPATYVTWAGAEPDKGASAWFILRYVDPAASIRVVQPDEAVGDAIEFDTPTARYRRTHRACTLESLLAEHPVNDPAVQRLAAIMHDIEINTWRRKAYPESEIIERRTRAISTALGDTGAIPMGCFLPWFDAIHQWLKAGSPDETTLLKPSACGS
ncbi:MAG: chromate resistance protein ChrB domain-containing protein [Panacagrimonas sp.]